MKPICWYDALLPVATSLAFMLVHDPLEQSSVHFSASHEYWHFPLSQVCRHSFTPAEQIMLQSPLAQTCSQVSPSHRMVIFPTMASCLHVVTPRGQVMPQAPWPQSWLQSVALPDHGFAHARPAALSAASFHCTRCAAHVTLAWGTSLHAYTSVALHVCFSFRYSLRTVFPSDWACHLARFFVANLCTEVCFTGHSLTPRHLLAGIDGLRAAHTTAIWKSTKLTAVTGVAGQGSAISPASKPAGTCPMQCILKRHIYSCDKPADKCCIASWNHMT